MYSLESFFDFEEPPQGREEMNVPLKLNMETLEFIVAFSKISFLHFNADEAFWHLGHVVLAHLQRIGGTNDE